MVTPVDLLRGVDGQEELPSYDDASRSSGKSHVRSTVTTASHIDPAAYNIAHSSVSEDKTTRTTTMSSLSQTPDALIKFIYNQSALPPRPVIRITGTHLRHNETISPDFDLLLNITPYIIPQGSDPQSRIEVSEIDSHSVPGDYKATQGPVHSLEHWSRTFCEDLAAKKSFSIQRHVTNWDTEFLHDQIVSQIRSLKFVGQVSVTFPVTHSKVVVSHASIDRPPRQNIMSFISSSSHSSSSPPKNYDVVRVN
ncbi:hypothetical protein K461DRAFT_292393 [Myriangium duriaei CBS 260.36]|uniref:Uncharacterized protein n=1 Tax=Myriangium duriaei CBS 260.36 TaxID=1168546 RepID=A0A9P4J201_9PEZI|nr:hypothetical protein K461DRAFT_292393 [Myriangium duriaei CBS 260.36]